MGDWDWLKDKAEPASIQPPPLPGPSPASQRFNQTAAPPSSVPPPLPGPSPAARDSQTQSTTSLSPPRLPGPSPAARAASKSVSPSTQAASCPFPLQSSGPAPAPGPMDDIEVDPGLLHLAEETARSAALLHEAVLQQLLTEEEEQSLATVATVAIEEQPAMIESDEEPELIPMGDDGIPSLSFLKVVGFVSSARGLSCLRLLSQVCQRWHTALQPSLFLFNSIRGTLTVCGSRRGSTEEVRTNKSKSADSSPRSSVEIVSARPSLDVPPAAAAGMTIINRGLQGLQGLAAMRGQEQERTVQAALAAKVEEMERTAAALKIEREKLFAQVQDGALQKKFNEMKIGELQAQWDAAVARGERPVEQGECMRCSEEGETLERVEEELAVAVEQRKSEEEARAREKKVLVAEVQRHRELLRLASRR